MQDNNTSAALPGAQGESAPDSEETVSVSGTDNASETSPGIAQLLSETLNKEFDSDEAALKAVKDTFSFVGKSEGYAKHINRLVKEHNVTKDQARNLMDQAINNSNGTPEPAQEAPATDAGQLQQVMQDLNDMKFFKSNPDLEQHESLLKEMRGNSGKTFTDIMESETFKGILTKVNTANELEKKKTVLQSNSRLGQASNKMTEAREASNTGNQKVANANAVAAVMEAYDLN